MKHDVQIAEEINSDAIEFNRKKLKKFSSEHENLIISLQKQTDEFIKKLRKIQSHRMKNFIADYGKKIELKFDNDSKEKRELTRKKYLDTFQNDYNNIKEILGNSKIKKDSVYIEFESVDILNIIIQLRSRLQYLSSYQPEKSLINNIVESENDETFHEDIPKKIESIQFIMYSNFLTEFQEKTKLNKNCFSNVFLKLLAEKKVNFQFQNVPCISNSFFTQNNWFIDYHYLSKNTDENNSNIAQYKILDDEQSTVYLSRFSWIESSSYQSNYEDIMMSSDLSNFRYLDDHFCKIVFKKYKKEQDSRIYDDESTYKSKNFILENRKNYLCDVFYRNPQGSIKNNFTSRNHINDNDHLNLLNVIDKKVDVTNLNFKPDKNTKIPPRKIYQSKIWSTIPKKSIENSAHEHHIFGFGRKMLSHRNKLSFVINFENNRKFFGNRRFIVILNEKNNTFTIKSFKTTKIFIISSPSVDSQNQLWKLYWTQGLNNKIVKLGLKTLVRPEFLDLKTCSLTPFEIDKYIKTLNQLFGHHALKTPFDMNPKIIQPYVFKKIYNCYFQSYDARLQISDLEKKICAFNQTVQKIKNSISSNLDNQNLMIDSCYHDFHENKQITKFLQDFKRFIIQLMTISFNNSITGYLQIRENFKKALENKNL